MSESPAQKPAASEPDRSATGPGVERVDRSDLVEAYKDLIHAEKERLTGTAEEAPPVRWAFWSIMLLLLVGSVGALVLKPEWFFPPAPLQTPQIQDASLRLQVYREILRVDAFRKAQGRLPASLQEAGGGDSGVQYTGVGGSYSLSASEGGHSVIYQSSTPPETFLGKSYDEIRRRPRS